MTIKPTTFVKEHAPWSVSKADTAKQCPHRFYLKYIVKKKVDLPPNADALVGQAVHRAVEFALSGRPVDKSFKFAIEEFKLTSNEIERARALIPATQNFLRKFNHYCKKHNANTPKMEQRFGIDFEGNPVEFFNNNGFLRGVIDLYMTFKGTRNAVILDHKTGKHRALHYFRNQFNAYILLLKANSPELEGIQTGINFLKEDTIEFVKGLQDVRDVQPIFEEIVQFLNESTKEAHKHELVRPGPLCGWCDYQHICPAHADGTNGSKEKEQGTH